MYFSLSPEKCVEMMRQEEMLLGSAGSVTSKFPPDVPCAQPSRSWWIKHAAWEKRTASSFMIKTTSEGMPGIIDWFCSLEIRSPCTWNQKWGTFCFSSSSTICDQILVDVWRKLCILTRGTELSWVLLSIFRPPSGSLSCFLLFTISTICLIYFKYECLCDPLSFMQLCNEHNLREWICRVLLPSGMYVF